MWKTLTSLAIWGPGGGGGGGFNNQTGPILVHIYPLFYINLHVKYKSNMIKKNCGHVGSLHKIKGYQGHQNVSITMETYVQQRETI